MWINIINMQNPEKIIIDFQGKTLGFMSSQGCPAFQFAKTASAEKKMSALSEMIQSSESKG